MISGRQLHHAARPERRVICVGGIAFLIYHIAAYDGGKCLVFRKTDMFRWLILWCLILSACMFCFDNIVEAVVKYGVFYTSLPGTGIIPAPWQVWSTRERLMFRISYYVLASGWALMMAVHFEEILFWLYLMKTIRTQRTRPWFKSVYFRIWVLAVITAFGVLYGAASIETTILTQMELNTWFAGGILSCIGAICSIVIVFIFPGFIEESRRQGANAEVLGKLTFFRQLNQIRTGLRTYYAISIMVISVDGFTETQKLNHSSFATDFLFCSNALAVMLATVLSILILLPRDMTVESGYAKVQQVYVRQSHPHQARQPHLEDGPPSYKSPVRADAPWAILGDRLDLDRDDVQDMHDGNDSYEMPFASRPVQKVQGLSQGSKAVQEFRSPLDINAFNQPVDLRVMMNTTTYVEKDA